MFKLNLGSGMNPLSCDEGWINIDKFAEAEPDMIWNLDRTPWCLPRRYFGEDVNDSHIGAIKVSSVSEVRANHVLEHLSSVVDTMVEMFRICENGALIHISVPHFASDDFHNDPTHKTVWTPQMMELFSKKACEFFKANNAANSPLALYYGVDFEIVSSNYGIDPRYAQWQSEMNNPTCPIHQWIGERRNVIKEINMTLKVIK